MSESFKIAACSFSFSLAYVASQVQVEATKGAVAWRHSTLIVAGLAFRIYGIEVGGGGTMHLMDLPWHYLSQWSRHMEWQDVIGVTLEMCARAGHMYISLRPAHESSILHLPSFLFFPFPQFNHHYCQAQSIHSSCLPTIPIPLVNSGHERASSPGMRPIASPPRPLIWLPRPKISS